MYNFQRIAFRGKSWQLLITMLFFICSASAQTLDTTRVRQGIYANPGYDYIGIGATKSLTPPRDTTVHLAARDSGSIVVYKGIIYLWNGSNYRSYGKATQLTDSSFKVGNDTIVIGGTGSQTLQQTFDQGTTFNKHNTINQAGYTYTTNGQLINKDTIRTCEDQVLLTFGVSVDMGHLLLDTILSTNWVDQVAGALGLFNWNRAQSGTDFIQYSGPGDSSFQSKLRTIPNYIPAYRYLMIGNYAINECLHHSTDSSTYRTALANGLDTLLLARGYPANKIIVLNGTPAPTAGSCLPLLATATLHVAQEKGVRYFDSYNYLLSDFSNYEGDGIHLSFKGQHTLATGLLRALNVFDSVQYVNANVMQVEKALTVHNKVYVYKGIENYGYEYIQGSLKLDGPVISPVIFNKGVTITGDNVSNDQKWLIFKNDVGSFHERYGLGKGVVSGTAYLKLFSPSWSGSGVSLGQINLSDGTTYNEYFHVNNLETKAFNQIIGTSGANVSGTTTLSNVSITGSASVGQEWNLYNSAGAKWGIRMGGTSPWYTDLYASYNNSANAVRLGWMASDGTTFNPVLSTLKNGNILIGTTIDNSIGALQVNGKATIATTDSSGSPANMLWIIPGTGEIMKAAIPTQNVSTLKNFIAGASNTSTIETDLFADTIPANTLIADGDKITFDVTGQFFDPTANVEAIFYFAGNALYTSTAMTVSSTGSWTAKVIVMRTSSSTAKASIVFNARHATGYDAEKYISLSSLDFTTTNIIKVTGTSSGTGGGSGDISADMGTVQYVK